MDMRAASGASDTASAVRQGLLIGAAVLALVLPPSRPVESHRPPRAPAAMATVTAAAPAAPIRATPTAAFRGQPASSDARRVADWVARSSDNGVRPFVILDKRDATVYVFDALAALIGESPVLLGFAPGDDSADGIGQRALEQVRAHEKTTPAGRFEGERGHDTTGEDVVWVDYDTSVAMHRVRVTDPTERRLERLNSANPADRRISFGCINVPVRFFERVVAPVFKRSHAIVYVLPETKPLTEVFGAAV